MFDTATEGPTTQHKGIGGDRLVARFKYNNTDKAIIAETVFDGDGENFLALVQTANFCFRKTASSGVELIVALRQLRDARKLFRQLWCDFHLQLQICDESCEVGGSGAELISLAFLAIHLRAISVFLSHLCLIENPTMLKELRNLRRVLRNLKRQG